MFDVSQKVFVLTGAGGGIGEQIAVDLLALGASVLCVCRSEIDRTDIIDHENCRVLLCDVTDDDAPKRIVEICISQFGRIDVLINNAGVAAERRIADFADGFDTREFSVNTFAPARLSAAVSSVMKAAGGGAIINISSVMAETIVSSVSSYAASKAALDHFTRAMAVEWGRDGIRVNTISPGWFDTPMTHERLEKGLGSIMKARTPLGRIGQVEELTGAIVFLSSDASRFVTGTTVHVDGGFRLLN